MLNFSVFLNFCSTTKSLSCFSCSRLSFARFVGLGHLPIFFLELFFLLFWGVFHEKKKRVRIFFYCGHYFHTYFGQELPPVSMSAILV